MSLNDTMAGLMNTVRNVSGTTGKLGIEDATAALSKLNLFHFETVYGVFSSGAAVESLTAPEAPGYTLLCWINAATDGQIMPIYIQNSTENVAQFWCYQRGTVNGDVHFHAIAVYIQSGFANVAGGS